MTNSEKIAALRAALKKAERDMVLARTAIQRHAWSEACLKGEINKTTTFAPRRDVWLNQYANWGCLDGRAIRKVLKEIPCPMCEEGGVKED